MTIDGVEQCDKRSIPIGLSSCMSYRLAVAVRQALDLVPPDLDDALEAGAAAGGTTVGGWMAETASDVPRERRRELAQTAPAVSSGAAPARSRSGSRATRAH